MIVVKMLRMIKGLSQRDLAYKLGVSPTTWHRIENADRPLPKRLLEPLADALAVSPQDLEAYMKK